MNKSVTATISLVIGTMIITAVFFAIPILVACSFACHGM